jgi:hypothetical protein
MATKYQDNLDYSLYNRRYIDFSVQRKKEIKAYEDKHRYGKDFSVDNHVNNNMYSGYNNYLNGNPSSVIFQDEPSRTFVYNQGTNNRNTRLTDSVKAPKDVSGYLIPQEEIKVQKVKSNYGQIVKGIL